MPDFWTDNAPPQAMPNAPSAPSGALPSAQTPTGGMTGNYGDVQSATGSMDPEVIKRAIHDAGIAQGRSEADLAATADRDNAYWTQQIQAKGGLSQYWLDRLKTGNQPGGGAGGGGSSGGGYGTGSFAQPPGTFTAPSGLDMSNDPGYLARMKIGTDAIQGAAAAKGSVLSGGTLKALERYGQDFGSNEYGNVYGRALTGYTTNVGVQRNAANDYWSRLQGLYAGGQQANQATYQKP